LVIVIEAKQINVVSLLASQSSFTSSKLLHDFQNSTMQAVAALHQGAPGQMAWLEDPPPALMTWLKDPTPHCFASVIL